MYHGSVKLLWILATFSTVLPGCDGTSSQNVPPAPPLVTAPQLPPSRFDLKAGGTLEIGGDVSKAASIQNGSMTLRSGGLVRLSGVVPAMCDETKLIKVTVFRKLPGSEESALADAIPKDWTCEKNTVRFQCEFRMGKFFKPLKGCRVAIQAFDGSQWKDLDQLEKIEIAAQ